MFDDSRTELRSQMSIQKSCLSCLGLFTLEKHQILQKWLMSYWQLLIRYQNILYGYYCLAIKFQNVVLWWLWWFGIHVKCFKWIQCDDFKWEWLLLVHCFSKTIKCKICVIKWVLMWMPVFFISVSDYGVELMINV